jgi:hypothetical protein
VIIDSAPFRARSPGGIRVRPHKLLSGCCLLLLASLACPVFGAQSVVDAAREAKEKKQKKAAAQPESAARKSKVITNDDVPEAKSSVPEPAPSKATGVGATPSPSPKPSPDQSGFPHGPDAAHVDFKITSPTIKRPALAETLWSVKNTSDHPEHIALKTIITGPCNYRRENDGGVDLTSGTAETDNLQVSFVPYPSDCPGTYTIELRASVAGRILGSGSDTITVD